MIRAEDCDISLLILAHNKAAYTRRCLASLFLSTLRPFHVVLADNGSTDETPDVFADFASRAAQHEIAVTRLRYEENGGPAVGRNRALSKLTGRYWVYLDNDIVVRTRSWLEKLRQTLEAEPRIGVVGPKLLYANPPHAIQCAGCDVTTGGQIIYRGRGEPRDAAAFSAPRDCQTLISATWMLRAEAARQAGPLDEQFSPAQFEDIDYCYQLRSLGWRCHYTPAVELYHFENVTTGRTPALNYAYLTVKNGLKFKNKWRAQIAADNGPPDAAWKWVEIPRVNLEDVPEQLELLD